MNKLELVLFALALGLLAHEAFHVLTARFAGAQDVRVILHPFLEQGDADRRTLFETRWRGGETDWGEWDEVAAWALHLEVVVGTLFALWRPKRWKSTG